MSIMSPPRLFLIFILALTTLLPIISARKWSPADLPNPQNPSAFAICNRQVKSIVCDPDAYLSSDQAARLDGVANLLHTSSEGLQPPVCHHNRQTSGPQLAVAIVNSITPSTHPSRPSDNAFNFARKIHDLWGVGDPACQNGIVLVFAIADRAFAISVGKGLKARFPDSNIRVVQGIIRDRMRAAEYGEAVVDAAVATASLLGGKMLTPRSSQTQSTDFIQVLLFVFTCAAITGFSFYKQHRQQSRYERCRRALDAMDRDRLRAGANRYVATSCPICLEDFEPRQSKPSSSTPSSSTSSTPSSPSTPSTSASPLPNESDSNHDEVQPLNENVDRKEVSARSPETVPGSVEKKDKKEKKSNADRKSKSLVLRCGHEFHESCIATWLTGNGRSNTTCPICRKPIDGSDSTNDGSSSNTGASSGVHDIGGRDGGGWCLYEPELRFRMRRAQFYYPDFITARMMDDWENNRYDTRSRMATHAALRSANPTAVARAARAAGNGGSSFSFGGSGGGGGSSGGGGGGGGGW